MTNSKRTTATTAVPYPLPPADAITDVLITAAAAADDATPGHGGFRLRNLRTPGEVCIARMYSSADHGQTWTCSGELVVPTGNLEATTLDLLLALKGLPLQPPGTQWRVDAWHLPPNTAGTGGPPPASRHGDDLIAQMAADRACPWCHFTSAQGMR